MTEIKSQSQGFIEAGQNMAEAERIINTTSSLFVQRLMEVTGNNTELVEDLMKDVTNLAGNAATLAVANRRVEAEKYKDNDEHNLHPDKMSARQESLLFGTGAAQKIISSTKVK